MPVTLRRKTFAALDEVPSATLNGMQDDTIAVSADVGAPANLQTVAKDCTVSAINELAGRVTTDETGLQTHRLANPIDHPDRSIGAIALHTQVVGAAFGEGVDMDLKAVDDEVVTARGTQPKLDNRLDVILMENGGFKPYQAVPTRGCVVDVSADGLTVTVGPGAFVANDGYWYLNNAAVTVAVPGGMTPGTQYYLYLTGNGTAGGAWTATLSTTPPDALGFHPADPAKRYRAAFTAATASTFIPLRKVGTRVRFTAADLGGPSTPYTQPSPAQNNLTMYGGNWPGGGNSSPAVSDDFARVPASAQSLRVSFVFQGTSDSNYCRFMDAAQGVSALSFGRSGSDVHEIPAQFAGGKASFPVQLAYPGGLICYIILLGYEDTW